MKRLDRGGRGNFLICFGVAYILLGQSYFTEAHPPVVDTLPGISLIPIACWGVVWIAAGAVAAVSGALYSPAKDRWGYLCLSCLSFGWGMSYLAGWLLDDAETGWRFTVFYWVASVAALIMAGMIDPATVDRMKAHDQEQFDAPEYPSVQA